MGQVSKMIGRRVAPFVALFMAVTSICLILLHAFLIQNWLGWAEMIGAVWIMFTIATFYRRIK